MSNTLFRVMRNASVIIGGNIISVLLWTVINIVLARYLNAAGFGVYSLFFVYLGFVSTFADLGLLSIAVREVSRDRSKAAGIIGNVMSLQSVLAILASLACLIVMFSARLPVKPSLIFICVLTNYVVLAFQATKVIFHVELAMEYVVFAEFLSSFFKLLAVLLLIWNKCGISWLIFVAIAANIPGIIFMLVNGLRFVKPKIGIDWQEWKFMLKESWPLALCGLLYMVYSRIDFVMLERYVGPLSVGHYAVAYKLTEPFTVIPQAFMVSVFPIMSKYFAEAKDSLHKAYHLSFKLMAILGLPIATVVCFKAKELVVLFFGSKFYPSAAALSILIWAEALIFVNAVQHYLVICIGKQRIALLNTAILAVANIVMNFFLIPKMGIAGSSLAAVLTQAIGVILGVGWLFHLGYRLPFFKLTYRSVLGSIAVAVFLIFSKGLPLVLVLVISLIIYAAAQILSGNFGKQEWELVRRAIKERSHA